MDGLTERVEQALARGHDNKEYLARLHFAAATGHSRRKRYDEAFVHYSAGNELRRAVFKFDREHFRAYIDKAIDGFGPEVFEALKDAGLESRLPVFIVGMPC